VRDKSATGFTVRELGGGTSDVPFAYRIAGRRRDVSAPRLNRVTPPKAPPAATSSGHQRGAQPGEVTASN